MTFGAPVKGLVAAVAFALWVGALVPGWSQSADLGHAWAVPVLMAYLWWERWGERPAERPAPWPRIAGWIAVLVLVLALLPLRLLLIPFPLWPALLLAYTAGFALLGTLAAWGVAGSAGVRWFLPPCLMLVSALPLPTMVEVGVILPVREALAAIVAELANLGGRPALALGTTVRLVGGWVGIDEACGGIRSLQACVMVGLFFGEWYRFGGWRRVGLLALSVGFALAGNFFRILFLAWQAGSGGGAVLAAHDATGWVAMIASVAGTGWLAIRWGGYRLPAAAGIASRPPGGGPSSPAWPAVAAAVAGLLLIEAGARIWFWRGERQRDSVPQWAVAWPDRLPTFQTDPLTQPAREMLRPDVFRAGHWTLKKGEWVGAYYVEWQRGQVARSVPFLHNPTVCLPLSGCELLGELPPIEMEWSGGRLDFLAYRFRRIGGDMLVAFVIWDNSRGRPLVKPATSGQSRWEWLTERWGEVAEARQHQPAQFLAVAIDWTDHSEDRLRDVLRTMIVPAD